MIPAHTGPSPADLALLDAVGAAHEAIHAPTPARIDDAIALLVGARRALVAEQATMLTAALGTLPDGDPRRIVCTLELATLRRA